MSTTIEDDTFPADPDLDVRPDPAKLRGYWGDPADRPPRPLWDPTGGDASPAERRADLGAADGMPAGATGETADPSRVLRTTGRRLGRPLDPAHETLATRAPAVSVQANGSGSPGGNLLAIFLSLVLGAVVAGMALVLLLLSGTYRRGPSLPWSMTPDLLRLVIVLLILSGIFLIFGAMVGLAVPRAWGWSALVAWVPLSLLAFQAVALLRPELSELPVIAKLISRLPDVSRHLLAMSGLTLMLLEAAFIGGFWGARSGAGTSRADSTRDVRESAGTEADDMTGHSSLTVRVALDSRGGTVVSGRAAPAAEPEVRDDRRSMGQRGYW